MERFHAQNNSPKSGILQPALGTGAHISLFPVEKRPPSRPSLEEELQDCRRLLARNLRHWLRERFREETNRPVALSRALNGAISKTTIARLLKPDADDYPYPGLDKLVLIARGLKIQPYDLLLDAVGARRVYGIEHVSPQTEQELPALPLPELERRGS